MPEWRGVATLPGACAAPRLLTDGAALLAGSGGTLLRWGEPTGWSTVAALPAGATDVLAARAGEDVDAVVLVDGALQRLAGSSWVVLPALPDDATVTSAQLVDDGLLAGTDHGVYLLPTDSDTWEPPAAPADVAVTADAWAGADGTVHWRLPGGDVLRRDASGEWTLAATRLPPALTSITEGPDGALLGVRDGVLVTVAGATTSPFAPAPSLAPAGVVHAPGLGATFAWSADCAVQRLTDAAS